MTLGAALFYAWLKVRGGLEHASALAIRNDATSGAAQSRGEGDPHDRDGYAAVQRQDTRGDDVAAAAARGGGGGHRERGSWRLLFICLG